jgi:hypothetical protein
VRGDEQVLLNMTIEYDHTMSAIASSTIQILDLRSEKNNEYQTY